VTVATGTPKAMSEPADAIVLVDSSVAVKWFLSEREAHVDLAWTLLESHLAEGRVIHVPDHLRLEVLNALLHRGLAHDDLQTAARALDGFRLCWHRDSAHRAGAAAAIAVAHDLTLYDAAFAALALELDAELVTADRRLATSGACRLRMLG
jgi:predicted nucleic acid-binding protein